MDAIPELEAAFDAIRKIVADRCDAVGKRAVADWLTATAQQHSTAAQATQASQTPPTTDAPPPRAPQGASRSLVERALLASGKDGVAPSDIAKFAATPEEKTVSYSTIRLELTRGRDATPPRYRSEGGRWFAA